MSVDILGTLNTEIEVLQARINEMKQELKGLKNQRVIIAKPIELARKIKKYETMYPESVEWNLLSLVRIDETFDEWYSRFGCHTSGGQKDKFWAREIFLQNGFTSNNYIKWLVESNDSRVFDTEVYKQSERQQNN